LYIKLHALLSKEGGRGQLKPVSKQEETKKKSGRPLPDRMLLLRVAETKMNLKSSHPKRPLPQEIAKKGNGYQRRKEATKKRQERERKRE